MNEFNENLINQKMDKAIISYQNDLNGIRAGRASITFKSFDNTSIYVKELYLFAFLFFLGSAE